jgi:hypothetical protein
MITARLFLLAVPTLSWETVSAQESPVVRASSPASTTHD